MWFVLCVLMEMCIGKHCVVPLTRMQKPLDDVPSWSCRQSKCGSASGLWTGAFWLAAGESRRAYMVKASRHVVAAGMSRICNYIITHFAQCYIYTTGITQNATHWTEKKSVNPSIYLLLNKNGHKYI